MEKFLVIKINLNNVPEAKREQCEDWMNDQIIWSIREGYRKTVVIRGEKKKLPLENSLIMMAKEDTERKQFYVVAQDDQELKEAGSFVELLNKMWAEAQEEYNFEADVTESRLETTFEDGKPQMTIQSGVISAPSPVVSRQEEVKEETSSLEAASKEQVSEEVSSKEGAPAVNPEEGAKEEQIFSEEQGSEEASSEEAGSDSVSLEELEQAKEYIHILQHDLATKHLQVKKALNNDLEYVRARIRFIPNFVVQLEEEGETVSDFLKGGIDKYIRHMVDALVAQGLWPEGEEKPVILVSNIALDHHEEEVKQSGERSSQEETIPSSKEELKKLIKSLEQELKRKPYQIRNQISQDLIRLRSAARSLWNLMDGEVPEILRKKIRSAIHLMSNALYTLGLWPESEERPVWNDELKTRKKKKQEVSEEASASEDVSSEQPAGEVEVYRQEASPVTKEDPMAQVLNSTEANALLEKFLTEEEGNKDASKSELALKEAETFLEAGLKVFGNNVSEETKLARQLVLWVREKDPVLPSIQSVPKHYGDIKVEAFRLAHWAAWNAGAKATDIPEDVKRLRTLNLFEYRVAMLEAYRDETPVDYFIGNSPDLYIRERAERFLKDVTSAFKKGFKLLPEDLRKEINATLREGLEKKSSKKEEPASPAAPEKKGAKREMNRVSSSSDKAPWYLNQELYPAVSRLPELFKTFKDEELGITDIGVYDPEKFGWKADAVCQVKFGSGLDLLFPLVKEAKDGIQQVRAKNVIWHKGKDGKPYPIYIVWRPNAVEIQATCKCGANLVVVAGKHAKCSCGNTIRASFQLKVEGAKSHSTYSYVAHHVDKYIRVNPEVIAVALAFSHFVERLPDYGFVPKKVESKVEVSPSTIPQSRFERNKAALEAFPTTAEFDGKTVRAVRHYDYVRPEEKVDRLLVLGDRFAETEENRLKLFNAVRRYDVKNGGKDFVLMGLNTPFNRDVFEKLADDLGVRVQLFEPDMHFYGDEKVAKEKFRKFLLATSDDVLAFIKEGSDSPIGAFLKQAKKRGINVMVERDYDMIQIPE